MQRDPVIIIYLLFILVIIILTLYETLLIHCVVYTQTISK